MAKLTGKLDEQSDLLMDHFLKTNFNKSMGKLDMRLPVTIFMISWAAIEADKVRNNH